MWTNTRLYRFLLFALAILFYLLGYLWSQSPQVISAAFIALAALHLLLFLSFLVSLNMLKDAWWGKILIAILILAMSINFFVSAASYWVYSDRFSLGMALSVFDSAPAEIRSMARMFLLPGFLASLFASVLRRSTFSREPAKRVSWKIFASLWLVLPALFWLITPTKNLFATVNLFYHTPVFVKAYRINSGFQEVKPLKVSYPFKKQTDGMETIVVIIGESMRQQNMSLYGYFRNTTPNMQASTTQLHKLENIYSAAAITNMSVPLMLSGVPLEDLQHQRERLNDNILALANSLGYRTVWLSSTHGTSESVKIVASSAQKSIYTDGPDDSVLEPFRKEITTAGPKLIVLQLNGSHPDPCDRYPEKYKDFKADPALDCYDNSLRFTDYLFGEITRELSTKNAALILTSDHGVKIRGDKYLHTDSKESTRVPYFIWVSPSVSPAFKLSLTKAERAQNTLVYPHVAELLGLGKISYPKPYTGKYLNLNFEVMPYDTLKE